MLNSMASKTDFGQVEDSFLMIAKMYIQMNGLYVLMIFQKDTENMLTRLSECLMNMYHMDAAVVAFRSKLKKQAWSENLAKRSDLIITGFRRIWWKSSRQKSLQAW